MPAELPPGISHEAIDVLSIDGKNFTWIEWTLWRRRPLRSRGFKSPRFPNLPQGRLKCNWPTSRYIWILSQVHCRGCLVVLVMFHALVYSLSGIASGKKNWLRLQNGGHFENFEILVSFWPQIWKDRPKLCQKSIFHGDDVIDNVTGWPESRPLYAFINELKTIFMITKTWTEISSLNFLYIDIMGLWLYSYDSVFMASSMTSAGLKVGENSVIISS